MQPAHHQVVKPGRRIPRKSLRLNIYTTDGLVAHPKPFAPVSFFGLRFSFWRSISHELMSSSDEPRRIYCCLCVDRVMSKSVDFVQLGKNNNRSKSMKLK